MTGADARAASAAPALVSANTRRAVDSRGGGAVEGSGACGTGASVVMFIQRELAAYGPRTFELYVDGTGDK